MNNYAAGISILTFIVAVTVSMWYYQFVFLPEANAKPHLAKEILQPAEHVNVAISEGSSQPSQTKNFEPKLLRGIMGLSNKVIWTNGDVTAHSVTSDTQYVDKVNGPFDSIKSIGLIPPKKTFEFTFTAIGEYPYHCEPHPWMTGKVNIVENFS